MNKYKVSIVIPNYNGEKLLKECLDSLLEQTMQDFETIIVDDASKDNSLDLLKDYPAKVIQNEKNIGFAGSVNKGIRAARGEFVLLLNNDVILEPDFLENILSRIEKSHLIFSVTPKMIRYNERSLLDDTGDEYTVFGWVYKRGDGEPVDTYNEADQVFSTCAAAGLYRRMMLMEIGDMDEKHFAYLEDVDLGWRARIIGFENWYEPTAVCYHIGSATLAAGEKYSPQKVYLSARNNIYIIYKNMPFFQMMINAPFLLLGFGIKAGYFCFHGYGEEYVKGLVEGLKTVDTLEKVKLMPERFPIYMRIQKMMNKATISYIKLKGCKFLHSALEKTEKLIASTV